MKSKLAVPIWLVALLGAALLGAGEPWKDKPYGEWTAIDLTIVLSYSPWVREVVQTRLITETRQDVQVQQTQGRDLQTGERVYRDVPVVVATPVEREIRNPLFIVRWESSLTLRQARVRQWELEGGPNPEQVRQTLELPLDYYVISISAVRLGSQLTALLKNAAPASAYLEPGRGKRRIPAIAAQFVRMGSSEALEFSFPRVVEGRPVIGPGEKKVKFSYKVKSSTFTTEFDLREMVRDGKPDL